MSEDKKHSDFVLVNGFKRETEDNLKFGPQPELTIWIMSTPKLLISSAKSAVDSYLFEKYGYCLGANLNHDKTIEVYHKGEIVEGKIQFSPLFDPFAAKKRMIKKYRTADDPYLKAACSDYESEDSSDKSEILEEGQ